MTDLAKKLEKLEEIKTQNIAQALQNVANTVGAPPARLDFLLKQTLTYIKEPEKGAFEPLSDAHKQKLEDDNYILSKNLDLVQEYVIKIIPQAPNADFAPVVAISTDAARTMAKIIFKKGSLIKPAPDLKKTIYRYLNKIKARNKMLIGVREKLMLQGIGELIAKIQSDGGLKEDLPLWLAKWKKPSQTINDAIFWRYKEKMQKPLSENDKIDYADRNFVIAVKKDEILVEYTKPVDGSSGRAYDGKFIETKPASVENSPTFNYDAQSIDLSDDGSKIFYKARADGFVSLEANTLKIEQILRLKNVNLKETGNIDPGINSGVTIIVESPNPAEDAVGPDMLIEASEIVIEGSVGPGAVIKAQKVAIKGQTHSTTTIFAHELEVAVLKGTAFVHLARVKSFENATMYSCLAEIEQLFTGSLNTKIAKIKNVRAPCEVRAAYAIYIESLACGDNRFYIDASGLLSAKTEILECKALIKESNKFIADGTKELIGTSKYIRDNSGNFAQIKDYIKQAKDAGQAPKGAYVRIFKEYVQKLKIMEELQKKLEEAEAAVEKSQNILNEYDKKLSHAFIYNAGLKWLGTNNIYFIFHGKNYVADRVIENLPAVEIVAIKEREKEGLVAAIGKKEDFYNIDINTLDSGEKCLPLEEVIKKGEEILQNHSKEKNGL